MIESIPGNKQSGSETITIRPVTSEDWPDFARLFEARGSPKNCWCMAWRGSAEERAEIAKVTGTKDQSGRARSSTLRREAMRRRIVSGVPVGLLAFDGDEPIGWCSLAPRPTYRHLGGPKDYEDRPDAVWSIACFFIVRSWRGRGLTRRLIKAAVAEARSNGAEIVEATPVEPDSTSYRFMGLIPAFAAAGFEPIGVAGHRRTVMRLEIGPPTAGSK